MLEESAGRSAGERGIAGGRIEIWCLYFAFLLSFVCYLVRFDRAYQVAFRIERKSRYLQHLDAPCQPALRKIQADSSNII